ITQMVELKTDGKNGTSGGGFRCCTRTERIRWVPIKEVIGSADRELEASWGGELRLMLDQQQHQPDILTEFRLDDCLEPHRANPDDWSLFANIGYTGETVLEIYQDYIDHLYPAFLMTFASFRCFLHKYGLLKRDDRRVELI